MIPRSATSSTAATSSFPAASSAFATTSDDTTAERAGCHQPSGTEAAEGSHAVHAEHTVGIIDDGIASRASTDMMWDIQRAVIERIQAPAGQHFSSPIFNLNS